MWYNSHSSGGHRRAQDMSTKRTRGSAFSLLFMHTLPDFFGPGQFAPAPPSP